MEIRITTGTYNNSDFRIVKEYKNLKLARKFVNSLGYKADIHNGVQFSCAGITYKVSINK